MGGRGRRGASAVLRVSTTRRLRTEIVPRSRRGLLPAPLVPRTVALSGRVAVRLVVAVVVVVVVVIVTVVSVVTRICVFRPTAFVPLFAVRVPLVTQIRT